MHTVLVCLHGWGGSKESFAELREALRHADIEMLTPDLPGFGSEPEPNCPWSTDNYADWVIRWIQTSIPPNFPTSKPLNLHLLGHSHGGRIAIKLAERQSTGTPLPFHITHLYLCAAAGIRHPRHFKRIVGLMIAKLGKVMLSMPGLKALQPLARKLLYKLVRVHDYEQASPIMQQTLMRVSAEDLRPLLSRITIPTHIFWGENDHMTPVSDGRLMHERIPGSQLHIFPGVRHRVHRDSAQQIAQTMIASRAGKT